MHPRHPHNRGEPLHRAHRDRSRPHRVQGSRTALRIGWQHAGHRVRRRQVQDLRGDAGHRRREHARQARQGPRNGVLRRTDVREARPRREGVPRAALFRQGDGCRVLRHDHRRRRSPQEGRPSRGYSALGPGDRVRHAHRGHRACDGAHREEGGPPRRRGGPERPSEGYGRGYGPRPRSGDVRPGQAVLQGQRRHDRLARSRDVQLRSQDVRSRDRRPSEIQNGRCGSHLASNQDFLPSSSCLPRMESRTFRNCST